MHRPFTNSNTELLSGVGGLQVLVAGFVLAKLSQNRLDSIYIVFFHDGSVLFFGFV
jgi:hypothetical protein